MNEVSVGELFVRLVVSLGVVVAIMAAAAWVLKRVASGGFAAGGRGRPGRPVRIEVLARQTLGRRSSIALVRAGGRGLVLGITEQHVTLLAETSADELVLPDTTPEPPGTAAPIGDPVVAGPTWRSLTETLRERTVRRS
ncbi:MAG TPA: flagellar biosynthetic protein FliO [Acidimicrobiales bacterium]|nr:flagellar biosynthetic protein FliO [Acidimicrobiales bacterium]